ncbi:Cochaperone prefoldin complex subunit [Coemansia erecta]|uniref:Cochaperone prefoldin complex subunit n=1 Tax=Coemansia asiatica TaxID=1052880 RepID=A0A9W7XQU7_9FUNG|nr:Cochaperone prefoldin complex subunit [Coemansia asiatica]KAJ2842809.1 Cochaperone prefoldin complex subunit [Coemansia erecta]
MSKTTASSSAKGQQQLSEQELRITANQYGNELKAIASKIGELELQLDEHSLVIKTMSPMPEDRKCFRLINGVLVERTVKEVLPALKTNKEGIAKTIEQLTAQYRAKDKEFVEFQQKNHIRVASA